MLRVPVLAALLVSVPVLAPRALAQQATAIRASAMVITSVMDAALQRDSAGAAPRALLRPPVQRLRIAGIGVIRVEAGTGQAIRLARGTESPLPGSAVIVEVFYVGS